MSMYYISSPNIHAAPWRRQAAEGALAYSISMIRWTELKYDELPSGKHTKND